MCSSLERISGMLEFTGHHGRKRARNMQRQLSISTFEGPHEFELDAPAAGSETLVCPFWEWLVRPVCYLPIFFCKFVLTLSDYGDEIKCRRPGSGFGANNQSFPLYCRLSTWVSLSRGQG